jgi:hypothetical protein
LAKRKSKDPAGDGAPADRVDFPTLRREIAAAVRRTFVTVRSRTASESLYAFALYSDDSAMTVCPAANTVEAFNRRKTDAGATEPEEVNILRWASSEWGDYCSSDRDEFATVAAMINVENRYDTEIAGAFVRFKTRVFASMVLALLDLDREGIFGSGPERDKITLHCAITDSWDSAWLEQESARRLNPAKVFQAFRKQWKTYRADDLELFDPKEDQMYQGFVRYVDAQSATDA